MGPKIRRGIVLLFGELMDAGDLLLGFLAPRNQVKTSFLTQIAQTRLLPFSPHLLPTSARIDVRLPVIEEDDG